MNRYKVTGRLGEGAHGLVLKGWNLLTKQEVALKKIPVRNSDDGIPVSVIREIKALQCIHCDNVIQLLDVFPQGLSFVLVFEYMPSGLWEMIYNPENPLSLSQIKRYIFMIFTGVSYLHAQSIMHRDLKPSNLLISKEGILKIADLGLARIFNAGVSRPYSHQVATRWYRAPELLYGARLYSQSVDIWSVGCIIAELLNNSPLFPGENDIEQLAIVFKMLGTPTMDCWPEMNTLPDYNKISFPESSGLPFDNLFPYASTDAVDLLKKLLVYDPKKRLSAKEAISQPFFYIEPLPCEESCLPKPRGEQRKIHATKDYKVDISMEDMLKDLRALFGK